ncbi:hypothetical protein B0H13DRAFT_2483239 [Mycena leptocephala]|nr:hypothetical protein B0H13DRAFT_2483239 [Mycena leptocephala]
MHPSTTSARPVHRITGISLYQSSTSIELQEPRVPACFRTHHFHLRAPSRSCDPLPHSRRTRTRALGVRFRPVRLAIVPLQVLQYASVLRDWIARARRLSYTGGRAYTQSIEDASFRRRVVPSRLSGTELEARTRDWDWDRPSRGIGMESGERYILIKIDDFNARADVAHRVRSRMGWVETRVCGYAGRKKSVRVFLFGCMHATLLRALHTPLPLPIPRTPSLSSESPLSRCFAHYHILLVSSKASLDTAAVLSAFPHISPHLFLLRGSSFHSIHPRFHAIPVFRLLHPHILSTHTSTSHRSLPLLIYLPFCRRPVHCSPRIALPHLPPSVPPSHISLRSYTVQSAPPHRAAQSIHPVLGPHPPAAVPPRWNVERVAGIKSTLLLRSSAHRRSAAQSIPPSALSPRPARGGMSCSPAPNLRVTSLFGRVVVLLLPLRHSATLADDSAFFDMVSCEAHGGIGRWRSTWDGREIEMATTFSSRAPTCSALVEHGSRGVGVGSGSGLVVVRA